MMFVPVSASDALTTVVVRSFAALRVLALVATALHLLVWRSWYDRHPVALVAGLLVEGWGLAYLHLSLRRGIGTALVVANVAAGAGEALAAGAVLPPVAVGSPGTWVFLGCAHAVAVACALTSRRLFVTAFAVLAASLVIGVAIADRLAAALPGSVVAGAGTSPEPSIERLAADPGGAYRRVVVTILLIGTMSVLIRVGVSRLRATAVTADGRLRAAAEHLGAEKIAVARARAERERERVLHDTVLNTLAGIAWGGGDDIELAQGQAADAIITVHRLLRGPGGDSADLDTRLDAVIAAAGRGGLRAELGGTGTAALPPDAALRPPVAAWEPARRPLPLEIVDALAAAVAELLSNVRRHAGTDLAWVTVHRTPSAVGVEVRDEGRGFDPGAVPADRLGLSRSVQARMADAGGRVRVDASPGRGVRVLLTWAFPAEAAPGGLTAPPADWRRPRSAEELRDAYTAGLRRAVATAALFWFPVTLPILFALPADRYPRPAVLGLWLALGVCVVTVSRRARRRPATRVEALGLVAAALVVTVATALLVGAPRADGSRLAIWPVLLLPLLLMQVTVARPLAERLVVLTAAAVTLTAIDCVDGLPGPLALTQLVAVLTAMVSLQILAAMGGPVLLRSADAAARAIDSETHVRAEREAEVRIRLDRARALGMIRREVLPLLAALRDGLLDPRDSAVRQRCQLYAGTIRRSLVTSQTAALGELASALFEAESRDLRIDVQVSGDLRASPDPVRSELALLLPRALRALPSHRALLTLICAPAAGSLTLTASGSSLPPDWTGMAASTAAVAARADADDGHLCLDLTWTGS